MSPHSLGVFAYLDSILDQQQLGLHLPNVKIITVWMRERFDVLRDLHWSTMARLRAVSKWQGEIQYFETSPTPDQDPPYPDRYSDIRCTYICHPSDIIENNKEDIRSGRLESFIECRLSPEKVLRAKLLSDGLVQLEIVRNCRKCSPAITCRQLRRPAETH